MLVLRLTRTLHAASPRAVLTRPSLLLRRFESSTTEPPRPSLLRRLVPRETDPEAESVSFRGLLALTRPERKTIGLGIGFLLISSSVSLSVPFTIGRLIDYFASDVSNLVIQFPPILVNALSLPGQLEVSPTVAAISLLSLFTIGAFSNAARIWTFRMAGQRIVNRLRQKTYDSALRQEVDFVERGEGDIVSRLSVDSTIVGNA
jgi:putative ABC transport system ATP-binding protein